MTYKGRPTAYIPRGKCRAFPRKRFTFPRGRPGTDTIDLSRGIRSFHLRGKCRDFPRKRFTFPRGSQGYRLHRPFSRHLSFPSPGKVPGFSAKTVHFSPWPAGAPAPQASLAALAVSPPRGKCRVFPAKTVHFPPRPAGVPTP